MKRTLAGILALIMLLIIGLSAFACANGGEDEPTDPPAPQVTEKPDEEPTDAPEPDPDPELKNPVEGKRVAYVMLLPSATIFQMWKDSCADLCKALNVDFEFFFCDGDFNRWQDTISTCAAAGYDGLIVSHGSQDGSYVFLKEIKEQYPDMEMVAFDIQFYADGEYRKLDGVTQMFQQDASLVTVLMDAMIDEFGEGVRLIKVWRGPNYISPFDRREVGWQEYENAGLITTVGEVQPLEDTMESANTVTAAYLQGFDRDDVDGIITYYNLYGQGVYNAILENSDFNGTNGDPVPMMSVDIDPVDITNMQNHPEIWAAAGTTDWTLNGEIAMRLLLLQIAGEHDKIYDPATDTYGGDYVEVPGSAILAADLNPDSTVENLDQVTDETYGNLDYLSEADWMPKDLIH
ncbi:MAG: ABC transporter substrate-binding protein [Clostridiaceae bacterium]|nr:ABC transporter substrate-binding protein [Clostridiaceae bacterium]